MSAVFPILHGILDQLGTTEHSEELSQSTAIKQFKETMSSNIVERFNLKELHNAHPMLLTAILDPRFKSLTLSRYTDTEQLQLKQSVTELMEMYKEFEEGLHSTTKSVAKRPRKLSALDKLLGEETMISEPTLSAEFDKYLTEPPLPRRENPLKWWKENAPRFKVVSYVAKRLLCMPATSTPSERVFSTAGLTVTKLRSCLKPKHVDALIFLNKNMSKLTN